MTRCLVVSAALVLTSTLRAQEWDTGPLSLYSGSVAIEYESLRRSRLMGVPVIRGKGAATRSTAPGPLTFRRTPGVSARVRRDIVAPLSKKDKAAGERLERMLADGSLFRNFDAMMRPYGLRSDDAADAVTAFWVMVYLLANDIAKDPPANEARAVRAQVASRLGSQTGLRANDARQALGESLVAQFMLMDVLRDRAMKRGDAGARERLAVQARASGRRVLGVDLKRIRLTDAGFVPKG